ncbi:Leucine-rich repeat-containing protein 15 [Stylophora pistillata]|uniref:Leucine-rich repeat-containing protein 15 n=1 Tax=Stylophora pistillata TaxID=50429 RepID=A0A2B4RD19_STYPI|nr:Leucine-rich repeat-containing protein 15 [Stylophora pistillata]
MGEQHSVASFDRTKNKGKEFIKDGVDFEFQALFYDNPWKNTTFFRLSWAFIREQHSVNSCLSHRYDRVMIANEENHDYGMYCGDRTGHTVLVSGKYVLITFHTDGETQERGFRLLLTAFPIIPPMVFVPASVVRSLPGYEVTCSATGSPPIYLALMRDNAVLVTENKQHSRVTTKPIYQLNKVTITFLRATGVLAGATPARTVGSILSTPGQATSTSFAGSHRYLTSNMIQNLSANVFSSLAQLTTWHIASNDIKNLSVDMVGRLTKMINLYLASTNISNLPAKLFFNNRKIQRLILSDNPIDTIEAEAFKLGDEECNLEMVLKNRTVGTLKYRSPAKNCTIYLNPVDSDVEAVKVERPTQQEHVAFISALMSSGFRRIPNNLTDDKYHSFLPCPLGTFSNSSTGGKDGCMECTPGGFFSDNVGHVPRNCKRCPTGSFVAYDEAPGTRAEDCKSCHEGTDTDFFAGYRACKCLKGHYRTHLFEKCHKCLRGMTCKDDHMSLKSGYWWEWRNKTSKDLYQKFIKNLAADLPALGINDVRYRHPLPTPYQCPREEACRGGLDSLCAEGYEGALCAVCSPGYYRQLKTCRKCPSKKWIMGQLSIVAAILVAILGGMVWSTFKGNVKKAQERSLIDKFCSKLKIVIGFYQVTAGVLQAFSYIKWPDSMEVIAEYSEILQMNVLQMTPIECLVEGMRVNAFRNMFTMMAVNSLVICISGIAYGVRKVVIARNESLEEGEKSRKLSQTKELVYRNLFFVLYVTYLNTCTTTANVLPIACQTLCRDDKEESCSKFLKADYSVRCLDQNYNKLIFLGYISTAYVTVLPAATFIALWKHTRVISGKITAKRTQSSGSTAKLITGLRFLFENYKPSSWYWELVEVCRKLILTSGLILVGQQSRSYIGLAWVVAGMYGVLFSSISPIRDVVENRMMVTSLCVTIVNLGIGAVSRIPAENIPNSKYSYSETVLLKALVIASNTSVIGLLVVQCLVHLYWYFKKWRQNPRLSFSCCLEVFLPLTSMQGDVSAMDETKVFENETDAGQVDTSNVQLSVRKNESSNTNRERVGHDDRDGFKAAALFKNKKHQPGNTDGSILFQVSYGPQKKKKCIINYFKLKSRSESAFIRSPEY